jgi:hypothetical protein
VAAVITDGLPTVHNSSLLKTTALLLINLREVLPF